MNYSQFLFMHDEISLIAVIIILFLADLFLCGDRKSGETSKALSWLPIALLGAQTAYLLTGVCPTCASKEVTEAFGGMYQNTTMTTIVKIILNIGTIIVFLMANEWVSRAENAIRKGEFYLLTLVTLLGMYFMMASGHFLMFFIGLEMASIPMTGLVAYTKNNHESAEAAAKYILSALFSVSLLLYGLSLIYGSTGTLYFNDVAEKITEGNLLQLAGLALFISGIGFKISLIPFHLWTADTYQGAPTPVTGYLSVISKGAAAFVLFTILIKVFQPLVAEWNTIMMWIIILSITIANVFAIRQNNIKRFMAFSAISQAGYLVLGVMGGTAQGMTALVYYLFVYMVANLGVFLIINVTEQRSNKVNISDYNGFYETNPKLSFIMTLCLFSLAGIPPFAGFFSKFFIFMAAFKAGFAVLVFIALVNTVISLYYYLLIVKAMYIMKSKEPIAPFKSDCYSKVGIVVCALSVVLGGILSCIYGYIDIFSFGM